MRFVDEATFFCNKGTACCDDKSCTPLRLSHRDFTVGTDGRVLCPDCGMHVKTGNGGLQNFIQRH